LDYQNFHQGFFAGVGEDSAKVSKGFSARGIGVLRLWVNTRSGKYWRPGSRFCGKTKQGEFMSELEALDRGYSPADGTGQ